MNKCKRILFWGQWISKKDLRKIKRLIKVLENKKGVKHEQI